jgi:integrase
MSDWIKASTPGVRYRQHATRKHGVGLDKYFTIRYKIAGKERSEGLGWASEGWSERKAAATLSELKANITNGTGPRSLAEKRGLREQAEKEAKEKWKEEAALEQRLANSVLEKVFARYCDAHSNKKSLKDEISLFKFWIEPTLGKKRLDEIVLLDLERVRKKMEKAGRAPRSIQYTKAVIRQIYNFGIKHGLFSGELPTVYFLEKQKFDNKRRKYLTPEEAMKLLEEIRKHSETTYRISLLSLNSGMRFGEIASLCWQHINTNARQILVIDPKNSETRSVFITDTILQMFESMERGAPDALVFPSRNGKRRTLISKVFDRAVLKLGLNNGISDRRMRLVFHSLRHSCASWLVNSGVPIPVIAKILGHKSITMTMRYSHVNDTSVSEAMRYIDKQQDDQKRQTVLKIQNN